MCFAFRAIAKELLITNTLFLVQPAHAKSSQKTSEPPPSRSSNGTPGLARTAIVDCIPALSTTSRGLFVQVSRALYRLVVGGVRVVLLAEPTSDKVLEGQLRYVQSTRYNWICYSKGIARNRVVARILL